MLKLNGKEVQLMSLSRKSDVIMLCHISAYSGTSEIVGILR